MFIYFQVESTRKCRTLGYLQHLIGLKDSVNWDNKEVYFPPFQSSTPLGQCAYIPKKRLIRVGVNKCLLKLHLRLRTNWSHCPLQISAAHLGGPVLSYLQSFSTITLVRSNRSFGENWLSLVILFFTLCLDAWLWFRGTCLFALFYRTRGVYISTRFVTFEVSRFPFPLDVWQFDLIPFYMYFRIGVISVPQFVQCIYHIWSRIRVFSVLSTEKALSTFSLRIS